MIDVTKIEKATKVGDGWKGRCPACAEGGADRTGNHLRIWGDGRFACVVNPGTGGAQHRKRIFALIGIREYGTKSHTFQPPHLKLVYSRIGKSALH